MSAGRLRTGAGAPPTDSRARGSHRRAERAWLLQGWIERWEAGIRWSSRWSSRGGLPRFRGEVADRVEEMHIGCWSRLQPEGSKGLEGLNQRITSFAEGANRHQEGRNLGED